MLGFCLSFYVQKKCCSNRRIYKFHRVPKWARSKELEKKEGEEGREGARVFYLHRSEQTHIPLALIAVFLYCYKTIFAFLHCLFWYFYFLSVSKDPLSLFFYCRHIILVLELLLFEVSFSLISDINFNFYLILWCLKSIPQIFCQGKYSHNFLIDGKVGYSFVELLKLVNGQIFGIGMQIWLMCVCLVL